MPRPPHTQTFSMTPAELSRPAKVRARKSKSFQAEKYQTGDLLPDPDVAAEDLGLVDDEGETVDD